MCVLFFIHCLGKYYVDDYVLPFIFLTDYTPPSTIIAKLPPITLHRAMKTITSVNNEIIKKVRSLHHAKYRQLYNTCFAEGLRTCLTMHQAGMELAQAYATEQMVPEISSFIDESQIIVVPDAVMQSMSNATTPSGLLCTFAIPQHPDASTLSYGLVLAHIADPGNMGALIRSCAAMNIKTVVIIEGTDPWSPKVIQASAGTIGMVNLFTLSWNALLAYKTTHSLCALVVHGGILPEAIEPQRTLLIVGSEAHGIPEEYLASCDKKVTIPMPGETESLNAAIAGSIAAYVIFCQ